MAEETRRAFRRGDFLTKNNKKGSFMIYEGNNLSESTYKRMTLVCLYDPEKYVMGDVGYETKPYLEVASINKPCTETVDTEQEDYWISICTDIQKQEALNILAKYGYYWKEDTLELVDMRTGELIRKVIIPDDKYYGQIIKPSSKKFKELAKKYCFKKSEPIPYNRSWSEEDFDY